MIDVVLLLWNNGRPVHAETRRSGEEQGSVGLLELSTVENAGFSRAN